MNVSEAASILGCARDTVKQAINKGVQLPKSTEICRLAVVSESPIDISVEALDQFIEAFEKVEPGRHPPVAVIRELRTETRHKCAICEADLPLLYHHILEWGELKHHDPNHMLAICGGCHSKIGLGQIDRIEQRKYKQKLIERADQVARSAHIFKDSPTTVLVWEDLHSVLKCLHDAVVDGGGTTDSQFDFSLAEIEEKNNLNKLGDDTFAVMRDSDEPFFGRIDSFLTDPRNQSDTMMYHETVDELRRVIAARQDEIVRFDDVLLQLHAHVCDRFADSIRGQKRTLRILISFMYFNCDIGRKK